MADNEVGHPLVVGGVPNYLDIPTYTFVLGRMEIWEGDGWKEESSAWKSGAYIASNLSGVAAEVRYSGPQAQELLSRTSINDVWNWRIGTSKHLVSTDQNGLIANHGLAVRDSEDSFRQLASFPWAAVVNRRLGLNVEVSFNSVFIFQIAGPKSLEIIERVLGEQERDLAHLATKKVRIPGLDLEIELSRIGMARTLAYEMRGPFEDGPAVFDAVYEAGKEFGIKRSGWRTYPVNHTEGGFPQMAVTFLFTAATDPNAIASSPFLSVYAPGGRGLSGSIDPGNLRARFRTPFEVNWGWMAKFDHEFIGKEALEAEATDRKRKTVTLRWNSEDIMDVFASQFEQGEEYKNFEFPTTPQATWAGGHADLVTVDGKAVGVSSMAVYSYHYREMLSQATLDLEQTAIGTEVIIHWGDYGHRIKPIRATVERFPYLDLPDNKDYDLQSIPSGVLGS